MRKRYRQFLSSALITTENGIVNARPLSIFCASLWRMRVDS